MSWRPPDWDSVKHNAIIESSMATLEFTTGFEAGADAMLEVLKAKGVRIETDDWPSLIYDETYDFYKSKVPSKKGKGWLLFIPDETKGG